MAKAYFIEINYNVVEIIINGENSDQGKKYQLFHNSAGINLCRQLVQVHKSFKKYIKK